MARYRVTIPVEFIVDVEDGHMDPMAPDRDNAYRFVECITDLVRDEKLFDSTWWFMDPANDQFMELKQVGWSTLDWQIDDDNPWSHIKQIK